MKASNKDALVLKEPPHCFEDNQLTRYYVTNADAARRLTSSQIQFQRINGQLKPRCYVFNNKYSLSGNRARKT